jgi:hypothetical protein
MVVRRADLECRSHEHIDMWARLERGRAGHVLHDQRVGAKRKVRPMLFGRANGQDHQRAGSALGGLAARDLVQEAPG